MARRPPAPPAPRRGARLVPPDALGLPAFAIPEPDAAAPPSRIFDLSSHHRAREALDFGLRIGELGFNIFVLGEDRSGRMTATLDHLEAHVRPLPRPPDWVYLNNFRRPLKPKPYRLPAGIGRGFRERMSALVDDLRTALTQAFATPGIARMLQGKGDAVAHGLEADFEELRAFAGGHGIVVERSESGIAIVPGPATDAAAVAALTPEEKTKRLADIEEVRNRIQAFKRHIRERELAFAAELEQLRRIAAADAFAPVLDPLEAEFGVYPGLARWLVELRTDLLDNLDLLAPPPRQEGDPPPQAPEERYAVNLVTDHGDDPHPLVVVEPNPSYENLFGKIEYRSVNGVAETDYTLIRAGALHRANGGVLVLRAEAVARHGDSWNFLKAALRDGCIRIEELHREGGMPMAGAPSPKPIPLDLKVVIVGAPRWYYTFFSTDPDFPTYFKIKADIDADMPADAANVGVYAALIRDMARRQGGECRTDAVQRLLAEASRWATDRRKLSARFELVEDVICEAARLVDRPRRSDAPPAVTADHICRALAERRRRNARVEDRSHELIRDGVVLIDTEGARVGQVNALTVRDLGDYAFGLPSRVSARIFVGRRGIVDIERSTELGGPLQQKGVLIIGGYMNGRYARNYPLSFSASITFEQNYGGVEGDSASMAELLAILSALAEVPLRQDLAITGSVNQNGESQAVGGVHSKIEGFHRACAERGLTGEQGVLIPAANAVNLVLADEVAADVAAGRFHVWTMRGVEDALELFTGLAAAEIDGRVEATLGRFDATMRERAQLWS